MGIKQDLMVEISDFQVKHEMATTAFSMQATGDPSWLLRLRGEPNKVITSDTIDRVRDFIRGYKK